MNFYDLLTKIKHIEEGTDQVQGGAGASDECGEMPAGDMLTSECGDMPGDLAHPPKQQDNVTMSVNMNGSGAGGIKDLLNILKDIENGTGDHSHDDVIVGEPKDAEMSFDDSYNNEPHTTTLNIDAVTPTGDDLASKGAEAEKVNGGGNPFNVDESLVSRLANLYNEVKSR